MIISWHLIGLVLLGVGTGRVPVPVSVMEGDPVTLSTNVTANQNETFKWYFNSNLVAEINEDQIKICTDNECKKGFGNRLKLDDQTGSLTIKNTRTTDSGEYHLDITNIGSYDEKFFNLTVHGVSAPKDDQMQRNPVKEGESDSGLSTAAIVGISVAAASVVVLLFIAGVIYYHTHCRAKLNVNQSNVMQHVNQENGVTYSFVNHADNKSAHANGHESAATRETSF